MFLSSSTNVTSGDGADRMTVLVNVFRERMLLLLCLPQSVTLQALRLLVVVSACLTPEEYSLIGPSLWTHCFDCAEPQAVLSVRTQCRSITCGPYKSILGFFSDHAVCGNDTTEHP